MIAHLAKIFLNKPPALAPTPGARVNLRAPFHVEKSDGVVLSHARRGKVYVEWPRGGAGWEPADKLSVIFE